MIALSKKILFILCFLLLQINSLFAQNQVDTVGDFKYTSPLVFAGGLNYQKQLSVDLGLVFADFHVPNEGAPYSHFVGLKFGGEFNLNSNFYVAPKVGLEYDNFLLGGRISLADYTNFNQHDWKFTPEGGLTLVGAINIFYGYNISLTSNRIDGIGSHRISISINYHKELWKR